jgi:hypothetical protein
VAPVNFVFPGARGKTARSKNIPELKWPTGNMLIPHYFPSIVINIYLI